MPPLLLITKYEHPFSNALTAGIFLAVSRIFPTKNYNMEETDMLPLWFRKQTTWCSLNRAFDNDLWLPVGTTHSLNRAFDNSLWLRTDHLQ